MYTKRKAAEIIAEITPEIADRETLSESLREFEERGAEVLGASRDKWEAAVAALKGQLALTEQSTLPMSSNS